MSKEVIEFIEYVLTAADLKCKPWKVLDIDNDNIYLAVDSETNNYNIRLWNIYANTIIEYSLYKFEGVEAEAIFRNKFYIIPSQS
jgi:hypothetical protein